MRVERNNQFRGGHASSRRRDPLHPGGPSSGEKDSAACTRCRPTAAERNSRRLAASAGGRRRGGHPDPTRAWRNYRVPHRCHRPRHRSPRRRSARWTRTARASVGASTAAQSDRRRESIDAPWRASRRAPSRARTRTNAAGLGPTAANNVSIELRTLATRPNASAAAQKPAISRSAGSVNGRTFWIGSLAASIRL